MKYIALAFLLILFANNIYALPFSGEQKAMLESEKNTIHVFQNTVQSVVNVSNLKKARRGWFDMQAIEVPAGAGSGFVWDEEGHIVTNFHVVQGGDKFLINFKGDKKQYEAKLVGAEPKKDTAVLKLIEKPKNLKPISVGKSKDLIVGQKAMAIGNPFGLDHTITSGIISALERKIPGIGQVTIHGMIQTDTSINPGNSGGPLLDSSGRLIGMNTVIYSASGSSAGVGFAVPVDTISRIVPQIIKHGKVTQPGLGIGILPEQFNYRFGIEKGIIISVVDPQGGAAAAGLEGVSEDRYGRYYIGDVILKVDGKEVNNFDDIYHSLDSKKRGDTVEVEYLREGKKRRKKVTLKTYVN